jgi:hypothetical protein
MSKVIRREALTPIPKGFIIPRQLTATMVSTDVNVIARCIKTFPLRPVLAWNGDCVMAAIVQDPPCSIFENQMPQKVQVEVPIQSANEWEIGNMVRFRGTLHIDERPHPGAHFGGGVKMFSGTFNLVITVKHFVDEDGNRQTPDNHGEPPPRVSAPEAPIALNPLPPPVDFLGDISDDEDIRDEMGDARSGSQTERIFGAVIGRPVDRVAPAIDFLEDMSDLTDDAEEERHGEVPPLVELVTTPGALVADQSRAPEAGNSSVCSIA